MNCHCDHSICAPNLRQSSRQDDSFYEPKRKVSNDGYRVDNPLIQLAPSHCPSINQSAQIIPLSKSEKIKRTAYLALSREFSHDYTFSLHIL